MRFDAIDRAESEPVIGAIRAICAISDGLNSTNSTNSTDALTSAIFAKPPCRKSVRIIREVRS